MELDEAPKFLDLCLHLDQVTTITEVFGLNIVISNENGLAKAKMRHMPDPKTLSFSLIYSFKNTQIATII